MKIIEKLTDLFDYFLEFVSSRFQDMDADALEYMMERGNF